VAEQPQDTSLDHLSPRQNFNMVQHLVGKDAEVYGVELKHQ